ncbi:hypothetical protein TNCT_535351 [Trichonephila clavata]|uniref:Uncharacterized protein n=1 Tax=Trichonephila clavata TaxID=2740835 RepID=A0A8X6HSH0_TRICU|nr:hypothetical protein TNCT_535351 [Trichonephila clavata]
MTVSNNEDVSLEAVTKQGLETKMRVSILKNYLPQTRQIHNALFVFSEHLHNRWTNGLIHILSLCIAEGISTLIDHSPPRQRGKNKVEDIVTMLSHSSEALKHYKNPNPSVTLNLFIYFTHDETRLFIPLGSFDQSLIESTLDTDYSSE